MTPPLNENIPSWGLHGLRCGERKKAYLFWFTDFPVSFQRHKAHKILLVEFIYFFFFLTPEGEKKILSDKHFYEYLRFQNAALDNNGNITGNSGNT